MRVSPHLPSTVQSSAQNWDALLSDILPLQGSNSKLETQFSAPSD